jgi:hypothetical protein
MHAHRFSSLSEPDRGRQWQLEKPMWMALTFDHIARVGLHTSSSWMSRRARTLDASMSSPDLARLSPDRARARAAGLSHTVGGLLGFGSRDALERGEGWTALAAVRVEAMVQRRDHEERSVEMAVAHASQLLGAPLPSPTIGFEREHVSVVAHGAAQRCSQCAHTAGRVACARCQGDGLLMPYPMRSESDCESCGGSGAVPCGLCEGVGKTVTASVLRALDRHASIHHVFVPVASFALSEAIMRFVDAQGAPPPALSVPLELRTSDAYRSLPLRSDRIGEHSYADVMPQIRAAFAGLAGEGEIVHSRVALHAWPFLHFAPGSDEEEVALICDASGTPELLVGARDAL